MMYGVFSGVLMLNSMIVFLSQLALGGCVECVMLSVTRAQPRTVEYVMPSLARAQLRTIFPSDSIIP